MYCLITRDYLAWGALVLISGHVISLQGVSCPESYWGKLCTMFVLQCTWYVPPSREIAWSRHSFGRVGSSLHGFSYPWVVLSENSTSSESNLHDGQSRAHAHVAHGCVTYYANVRLHMYMYVTYAWHACMWHCENAFEMHDILCNILTSFCLSMYMFVDPTCIFIT